MGKSGESRGNPAGMNTTRLRVSLIGALRVHVMPSQRSLNPNARALDDLGVLVTQHRASAKPQAESVSPIQTDRPGR
jgi:hypothetical protein